MIKIKIAFLLLSLIMTSCAQVPEVTSRNLEINQRLGWLEGKCLASENPDLTKDTDILVILLDTPQSITSATIIGPANPSTCNPLLPDRIDINVSSGLSFYRVKATSELGLAIGILNDTSEPSIINNRVRIDIEMDGNKEQFTYCVTSEGISFDVWSNEPYEGIPVWSGYYYLGYDVERTCP